MFAKLTDFAHKRTTKEAVGFYIVYLLLLVVAATLLGGLIGLIDPEFGFEEGLRVGNIVAVVAVLALSIAVVVKKNLQKELKYILLILASGVLALIGGGLLGLIVTAFLTTRENKLNTSI